MRGYAAIAYLVGEQLFSNRLCEVQYVTNEDIINAWSVFHKFRDKDWSFTDCVSRTVMERLKIGTAFAFDDHFRQFGSVTVVP